MNCGRFETIIADLARAGVMDAGMRADALAHAEVCARCAVRLADERALTQTLRTFTAASESIEAPPSVETNLRAAFHNRAVSIASLSSSARAAKANLFNIGTAPRRSAWMAIAAMLLVAIGLTAATKSFYTKHPTETATVNAENSNTALTATRALSPQDNEDSSQNIMPVESPGAGGRTAFGGTPKYARYTSAANSSGRNVARRIDRSKRLKRGSGVDSINDATAVGDEEIATDFLPLVDANNLAAQDGGQLLRVEMPRSALLAFGLPMNIERADEPVKADLLVGHDGLARAIRFVR